MENINKIKDINKNKYKYDDDDIKKTMNVALSLK